MDSLKIQGIFPTSISDISYVNEESQFGGQSITHHKNQQKLSDYHIKIKRPDNTHIFKHQSQQKPITSLFQHSTPISNNPIIPYSSQILPIAHIPQQYNETTTGYQLHRQSFSQQEILKAFNIIDINKDNMITEEDLIFILDYMNQQYTIQEVRQMISMISVDGLHVGFDQFKKLGRGDIIPLAKFKIGGKNNKEKEHILKNVEEQGMLQQDPKFLIENLKKDTISIDKFEQLKKGTKIYNYFKTPTQSTDKLYKIVPILSKTQHVLRKNKFHLIVTTTIQNIIQNYNENQPKIVDLLKIAHMLQITVKQVKQLYPNINQINSLVAVMQGVAFSNQNMFKKLQMSLDIINSKDTILIDELVHILQVLRGRDQSIFKKIKAICENKGLDLEKKIKKNLAYQIVLQFSNKIFGFD